MADDANYLLDSFGKDRTRRGILKGMLAAGAGGLAFSQFAEALAQASADAWARASANCEKASPPAPAASIPFRMPRRVRSLPKLSTR